MIQNRTSLANNTLDYEIDYDSERDDARNVHEG